LTGELGRYRQPPDAAYPPGFDVILPFRLNAIDRGGNHRPFAETGWPGLRFTERLENYKHQPFRPTISLT
jgi:hypothetical protein